MKTYTKEDFPNLILPDDFEVTIVDQAEYMQLVAKLGSNAGKELRKILED